MNSLLFTCPPLTSYIELQFTEIVSTGILDLSDFPLSEECGNVFLLIYLSSLCACKCVILASIHSFINSFQLPIHMFLSGRSKEVIHAEWVRERDIEGGE